MPRFDYPSISVVIPVFNRAGTIEYCLDSVLSQSLHPLEIIVVDDCSIDETVDIVESYNNALIRCIVLDKNSGAQAARNRGICEAKGDWIAFQDSDDEWMPEKLQKQLQALARVEFDPWTVVHTNALVCSADGRKNSLRHPEIDGENVYGSLLAMPAPMFQGMLVSRKALDRIGLLDEQVPSYQEWDTSIRLSRFCCFVHLREPLFTYHLHAGDTISKSKRNDIEGYQHIVDKFRDEIISTCGSGVYNGHLIYNALKSLGWGFPDIAETILDKCVRPSYGAACVKVLAKMKIGDLPVDLLVRAAELTKMLRWKLKSCRPT